MSYYVHIYDPATKSDIVLPIAEFMRYARDNSLTEEHVHALIDAARYEQLVSHNIVRGRFARLNWNILTDPLAGALAANTWRVIGIGPMNRFNTIGIDGWSYSNDAQSHYVVRKTGWYELNWWSRGSVSMPAVPLYLMTSVHLGYRITRAAQTPNAWLQLPALDGNGDVPLTSTPGIQELGDYYAPCTVAGGPPVATQTYIRAWGLNGSDAYPFYAGDIVEMVWMFKGGGPVEFLDSFEARMTMQRIENFWTRKGCCE